MITLLKAISQFFLYAIAASLAVLLIYLDIVWLHNNMSECSLVEISQELCLLIISGLFFYLAQKNIQQRQLSVLIGGLFLCMFIREIDGVLDHIQHGFWFYPAIIIALLCISYSLLRPKELLQQLIDYTQQPTYGFMMSGIITIVVFSRLFGMKILWMTLSATDYIRTVKNVAEEGCELFGYLLCLVATILYVVQQLRALSFSTQYKNEMLPSS